MIWIASFPRSGNTFIRNILHDVYGMKSSEFHMEKDYHIEEDYASYPFVKTHLLPSQLVPNDPSVRAVYIVRDGRDTMVSIAHQRSDIVAPGSDFRENLKAAIFAERGTFFGGWTKNVEDWVQRADILIRYEDLLRDPIGQVERLRTITELPQADPSKLPDFDSLKKGDAAYGARKSWGYSKEESEELAERAFRKGKSGGWKTEMPDDLHDIFWTYHGITMERLGYTREGEISEPLAGLDHSYRKKLGITEDHSPGKKYKILIEANKMATRDNDGVKRYLATLIKGYLPLVNQEGNKWDIDLLINKEIIPLREYSRELEIGFKSGQQSSKAEDKQGPKKSIFEKLEALLLGLVPDKWVKWLVDRNILLFHKIYDLSKKLILNIIYWIRYLVLFLPRMGYTLYLRYRQRQEQKAISDKIAHYDLIHVPLKQHYWPFRFATTPLLFTIHDFTHKLFPKFHTGINIRNAEQGMKLIQKKGAHVLAVSASTLKDSKNYLDLPARNFHLAYEAVEEEKFRYVVNKEESGMVREKYGIRKDMPFILLLGTIEPRKNVINSIQAFQQLHKRHKDLNLSLVIAGKQGWKMKKFVGYSSLVSFTGFVDDDDLSALYSEALALSYVSYYEGFGLPILEAMRCGTPVVYGNNSSMPEVAGDGGLGADPASVDDICDQYEKLITDESFRHELERKAMHSSLRFSSRKSVIDTLNVYEKVITLSK
jgi:glycosyltransferase involved in cell wall biosynthesis